VETKAAAESAAAVETKTSMESSAAVETATKAAAMLGAGRRGGEQKSRHCNAKMLHVILRCRIDAKNDPDYLNRN
jgi:hypothetical protein